MSERLVQGTGSGAETLLRIDVTTSQRGYEVLIGRGLLAHLDDFWECEAAQAVVCCDENVASRHLSPVVDGLRRGGATVAPVVIPPGEREKSASRLALLYERLYELGIGRQDTIVALGGGVVGDLVGYAAATFLRGVRLVQAPTTLLAMVDAAVGGKVAIDYRDGKNYIGTFYQPWLVVEDLDAVATLPEVEMRNGWAEIVKCAFLTGGDALEGIERALHGRRAPDESIVAGCVRLKAEIVGRDEREEFGERALLNLGHTIGHAVEAAGGFAQYSHGDAVGLGLRAALWLSRKAAGLNEEDEARGQAMLSAAGLPERLEGLQPDAVARLLARDKKAVGGSPRYVLLTGFGAAVTGQEVDARTAREALRWLTRR